MKFIRKVVVYLLHLIVMIVMFSSLFYGHEFFHIATLGNLFISLVLLLYLFVFQEEGKRIYRIICTIIIGTVIAAILPLYYYQTNKLETILLVFMACGFCFVTLNTTGHYMYTAFPRKIEKTVEPEENDKGPDQN